MLQVCCVHSTGGVYVVSCGNFSPFSAHKLNGADTKKSEHILLRHAGRHMLHTGQEVRFNAKPSSYFHHKYLPCNRSKASSVSSVNVCASTEKGVDKKWVLASRRLSAL